MEGRKQMGSFSSTSELFGSNQFQKSSASGIFESMFPPPSKVLGRERLRSEVSGKTASERRSSGIDYNISKGSDGETQSTTYKDMSYIYQEQRLQPCQLSSSIHYGGQDIYYCPKSTQDSELNSLLYKKDGVEDDLGSNLWQGGPYY